MRNMPLNASRKTRTLVLMLLVSIIACPGALISQSNQSETLQRAPRVFIDCNRCDTDYIRTEINYVDYVRDRKTADIHVLIVRERTGGGGDQYTLAFLGNNWFTGKSDTLRFTTNQAMSDDDVRERLVQNLEIGLLPFVAKSIRRDQVSLDVTADIQERIQDPWNHWVFEVSVSGNLEGEESQKGIDVFSSIDAERVTKALKMDFRLDGRFHEEEFTYTDSETNEEVTATSIRKFWDLSGDVIPSLTSHWSIAAFSRIRSSSYQNLKRSYEASAGIEYNIFPYSESVRREFRLQYRLGYLYNNYYEETLFGNLNEGLFQNDLYAILTFTQPWGEAQTTLEASSFLDDFSKNRLIFDAELEVFLFEGFSLDLNARYSIINDQIYLKKGDLSPEEVLLRQSEMATSYEYDIRLGVSYTFGSIYDNVVNPRFDRSRF